MDLKKFIRSTKGEAYKTRVLKWFKLNLGKPVTSEQFAQIPGADGKPISHNIRRVFELRDEDGYEILNHKDNSKSCLSLKIDEWVLVKSKPNPKKIRARGVNKRIMVEVFARDNNTCQFCGRTPQDDDPFTPGHKIKLHVGHIIAHKREDGKDIFKLENIKNMKEKHILTKDDFKTMCNVCNEGLKNKDLQILSPSEKVLSMDKKTQKQIFNALKKKFA